MRDKRFGYFAAIGKVTMKLRKGQEVKDPRDKRFGYFAAIGKVTMKARKRQNAKDPQPKMAALHFKNENLEIDVWDLPSKAKG